MDPRAHAASARRSAAIERVDLLQGLLDLRLVLPADRKAHAQIFGGKTGERNAQIAFVAVEDACRADQVDAPPELQSAQTKTSIDDVDREARAGERVGARIGNFSFSHPVADEAEGRLQGFGRRLSARPADSDPVETLLGELDLRNVEGHVRSEIGGGIVYFVQELLFDSPLIDNAACAAGLVMTSCPSSATSAMGKPIASGRGTSLKPGSAK